MRLISRLIAGYVALIAIWFVLWLTVKDAWWWLTLVNRVVPQLFLPAPFILAAAIISGQRKLVLTALVPWLIFGGLYGQYLVPQLDVSNVDETALRVMTFNVLYSNTDYDAVANVVKVYQPDLIAFQEVQPAMMAALTERLGSNYPYSFMNTEHPYGTTAAFSRLPISDAYSIDLAEYYAPRVLVRPAVVMKVETAEKAFTFVAAHLLAYGLQWVVRDDFRKLPATVNGYVEDHQDQAALLVNEIMSDTGGGIVACDCNSPETAGAYRVLAASLTNSVREAGWVLGPHTPGTVRPDFDLAHIDFVFHTGHWKATEVFVIQDFAGSDHLPVMAVLKWNSP